MALAQLWEVDSDAKSVVFNVDTGTNPLFCVQLGTHVRLVDGIPVLDAPYWSSPWQRNPEAGRHLDTTLPFTLDRAVVRERHSLIQAQSAKDDQRRGRAFSTPVRLGGKDFDEVHQLSSSPDEEDVVSVARTRSVSAGRSIRRNLPHTTANVAFSRQASMDDFLGTLVRIAGPILKDLLSQPGEATSPLISPEVLGTLLRSALEAAAKTDAKGAAPVGNSASIGSQRGTLPMTDSGATSSSALAFELLAASTGRLPMRGELFSTPKSVKIDWRSASAISGSDLLARLTDSLIGILPQLLNAVAMRHILRRDDDAVLVREAISVAERMRLLQLLSPATIAAPSGSPADDDVAQLMRILAASPIPAPVGTPSVPAPAAASAPPATARAQGVPHAIDGFASKAVLTPILGPPMQRQDYASVVFTPAQSVTLRFQLDVGSTGPVSPLPRAILDVVVREPGAATTLLTRTERLTQVKPGTPLSIRLTSTELALLPREVRLEVTATLRWPGRAGVYHAGCSSGIVLAGARSVAARGATVGEPRELIDMARFRSFWNRVWATTELESDEQPLWGFDAALRYSVVLTGSDRGNGIMSTRANLRPGDGGLRVVTGGKIKGGIEIGLRELNTLLPLWDSEQPLAADVLEAFAGPAWLASNSGDATFNVRFEGRRRTRGLLWAVPILGLRTFTLASPGDIDPFGQVLSMTSQDVRFPVIEAVRLLGLRTTIDEETPEPTTSGYRFDGYEVAYEAKEKLQPASGEAT